MTLPEWCSVQTAADRWILIGFRMEQKKVKKVCYYICRARQADDKCIGHQITEKLLKALVMDQLHLFIVRLSDKRKVLEELRKIEDMQNPVYRAKVRL